MMHEDAHTLKIDIRRSEIYPVPIYKKMQLKPMKSKNNRTHKSPIKDSKYTLFYEEYLPAITVKVTDILLPFKLYYKTQKRKRFKHRTAISIFDKYKITSTDLQKRLYTEGPGSNVVAVTDTDEDYFSCISGRPISGHIPAYKSLKLIVNNLLRVKYAIGNKYDCVLNIETNFKNELASYNLSVQILKKQSSYFNDFISEDYKKSITLLKKWEDLKTLVDFKSKELQHLAVEKFTIMSRLINLDYKYSVQLQYGRFLYYLSPHTWRINNRDFARSVEIEAKGFDFGASNEDDTFAVIFNKMYGICFSSPVKPVLYFAKQSDLMKIFSMMEEQQLFYFTHVNHLAPFIKELKGKINLIKLSEDRCILLETQFFKILHGLFYDATVSSSVLKLNINLEFCFHKIIGERAVNMNIVTLTKSLENLYMRCSRGLDGIGGDTFRCDMSRYIEKQKQQFKKARIAAKELRLFNRLKQEMFRSYGISSNFQTETHSSVTKPKLNRKNTSHKFSIYNRIKEKKATLTETEMEYLTLFTEWTLNEDPTKYLQRLKTSTSEVRVEGK